MIDLSHITIPQTVFTLLGIGVFSIAVTIAGAATIKWVNGWNFWRGRRVGSRSTDDIKDHSPFNGSLDRLIDALRGNAEANQAIATALATLQESHRMIETEIGQSLRYSKDSYDLLKDVNLKSDQIVNGVVRLEAKTL